MSTALRPARRWSLVTRSTLLLAIPALVGGLVATSPPSSANATSHEPTLVGRAVLPADTLAPGPPAGAGVLPPFNGIVFPRPSQPVEGFSSIVDGRSPGEFLAMADNGFGAKANSQDFLIRAYFLRPNFKTARGGSGSVQVGDFVSFRDPDHRLSFPIVNEATSDRLLTGGDIDPESLQRDHDGDLWVGDEFGPWILHFDADGPAPRPALRGGRHQVPQQPDPGRRDPHPAEQPRFRGHGHQPERQVPVRRPRGRHGGRPGPGPAEHLPVQRPASGVHRPRAALPDRGRGQPGGRHVGHRRPSRRRHRARRRLGRRSAVPRGLPGRTCAGPPRTGSS